MLKRPIVFILLLLAPLFGPIFGAGAVLGVVTAQTERNASALSAAPRRFAFREPDLDDFKMTQV